MKRAVALLGADEVADIMRKEGKIEVGGPRGRPAANCSVQVCNVMPDGVAVHRRCRASSAGKHMSLMRAR